MKLRRAVNLFVRCDARVGEPKENISYTFFYTWCKNLVLNAVP